LGNCDLLLVLGSRLDLRQTGVDTKSFQQGKLIFHVDIDDAELNNRFSECAILNADYLIFYFKHLKLVPPLKLRLIG